MSLTTIDPMPRVTGGSRVCGRGGAGIQAHSAGPVLPAVERSVGRGVRQVRATAAVLCRGDRKQGLIAKPAGAVDPDASFQQWSGSDMPSSSAVAKANWTARRLGKNEGGGVSERVGDGVEITRCCFESVGSARTFVICLLAAGCCPNWRLDAARRRKSLRDWQWTWALSGLYRPLHLLAYVVPCPSRDLGQPHVKIQLDEETG
jgi:hypothetical protein